MRGDGPGETIHRGEYDEAPPRARGWTPRAAGDKTRGRGSPACAGMDLRQPFP